MKIRPFGTSNIFLLFIFLIFFSLIIVAGFFIGFEIAKDQFILQFKNIICGIFVFLVYILVLIKLLNTIFSQYIVLYDSYIEIHYFDNKHLKTLIPKRSVVKKIFFHQLAAYGAFLCKDINDYRKEKELLHDTWFLATQTPVPIPLKMPKIVSELKDILLFIETDGNCTVINGGQYGLWQVKDLLYQLKQRTNRDPIGRVSAEKNQHQSFYHIARSLGVLICIIIWLIAVPFLVVGVESILNPLHSGGYQSAWKTIYVICIFLANFLLLLYIALKKDKQSNDLKLQSLKHIVGWICGVLYLIFVFCLILSFLL